MIEFYSGTPGSGKTFHAVKEIHRAIANKRHVITNIIVKPHKPSFAPFLHFIEMYDTSPEKLAFLVRSLVVKGKEGEVLIVIDEAGAFFNVRDTATFDRRGWLKFFQVHRHMCCSVIMIAQYDKMVDKQIRCMFESEIKHRAIKRYKLLGLLLSLVLRGSFIAVTYWYGCKLKLQTDIFFGSKKVYKSYNTFDNFHFSNDIEKQEQKQEQQQEQQTIDEQLTLPL